MIGEGYSSFDGGGEKKSGLDFLVERLGFEIEGGDWDN